MLTTLPSYFAQADDRADHAFGLARFELRHAIVAAVILAAALLLNRAINLAFARADRSRARLKLSQPQTATRLRATRRLINAGIWLFAVALAIGQFPELRLLSAGLIASASLSTLLVGLAARNTLGNLMAGVILAFAQPIRIGDDIEFRGERGTVEDISIFFTVVKLGDGRRLIVPNDTVATEVIKNYTLGDVTRVCRADVLVPLRGDAAALREALLAHLRGAPELDAKAAAPEVYWVRVDDRGTLLRLVATCRDGGAADALGQKALRFASEQGFRERMG